MNNIEIAPFYVGQEVIAIENHSQSVFKKGDEFIVKSLLKCKGIWCVTIGIVGNGLKCRACGSNDQNWHFYANKFRPKIEISEFISMKQFADKQLELIGAN